MAITIFPTAFEGEGGSQTRIAARARQRMVAHQLAARGITDRTVLDAMGQVPREAFVDPEQAPSAYDDGPLPIAAGQTISQPYIVAAMIEAAGVKAGDRVLEVGAGSGYAAAVISRIAARVYAIERQEVLAGQARARLARLGYDNVEIRCGDGSLGWPETASFDAIIVSAGGPVVPDALTNQLAPMGRLVMPVGSDPHNQRLVRISREPDGDLTRTDLGGVRFVPLIGAEGWPGD